MHRLSVLLLAVSSLFSQLNVESTLHKKATKSLGRARNKLSKKFTPKCD